MRSVGRSVGRPVGRSVGQSVGRSVRRSVGPSVRLFVRLSVRLSVRPSVRPSCKTINESFFNRARALAPCNLLVLVFGGHFSEAGVVPQLLEGWFSQPLEFNTYPFPFGTCLGGTSLFLSHVDLFTSCFFR